MRHALTVARFLQGQSQRELAGKVGVTKQAISLLECGHAAGCGRKTKIKIARALGYEPEELFREFQARPEGEERAEDG
jgi:transcriptional regulator with XRE-family HTH domain